MPTDSVYDFVVVGSGFGGSVSAMRLTEKGYRVAVLEQGKRYRDEDFAPTNWMAWKYLWLPGLRFHGILQISLLRDVMILHGCGVGGGSLGYASVLMEPSDKLFAAPAWRHLADWKTVLWPHYDTARRMLGVAVNPCLSPADGLLKRIADEMSVGHTFHPSEVGVFFGEQGKEVPDPYFGGAGPERRGCIHCGGCMVGCRHNAKNTLVKNYLYFAEKWGAAIRSEVEVCDIRPLPEGQADGARYEVLYRSSTAWLFRPVRHVRARNVVVSAGVLGTLRLLLRCRDETRSMPRISARLGELVRTNSEALLGAISRNNLVDYSKGVAITSVVSVDEVTQVEPVRYPAGSSLMRFLAAPLIDHEKNLLDRLIQFFSAMAQHPIDFFNTYFWTGWSIRTTILLVMQTVDNRMRLRWGRDPFTLFRRGLVASPDPDHTVPARVDIGHKVARSFAEKIKGIPAGSIAESLLNYPMTAHIMGGCPFGRDADEGVVDLNCEVHNYPGLYVVDGSIMPANPGINPSLTITALAEYAMSRIPARVA